MSLKEQLAEYRADWYQRVPADRQAIMQRHIDELRAGAIARTTLKVGDQAPPIVLKNAKGTTVDVGALIKKGPVIVTLYRGGWCPYCNLQLRAYQAALPEMTALGAQPVAISPQLPDGSLSTAEANELTFDVLSDVGNRVARSFGLVWSLSEELREALRSNNKALPGINGDDSWELPVPATYVVARDGRVALAAVDVDYRNRLEPDAILATLRSLRPV